MRVGEGFSTVDVERLIFDEGLGLLYNNI